MRAAESKRRISCSGIIHNSLLQLVAKSIIEPIMSSEPPIKSITLRLLVSLIEFHQPSVVSLSWVPV